MAKMTKNQLIDAVSEMLGEEGRGIHTIIEMAHVTRLDFAVGSSGC
jgi:putative acyl-CoA dehydrogenase